MFEYTAIAAKKTIGDIKKLLLIINFLTICGGIAYLVYSLSTGGGNVYANHVLLLTSALYLVFFILNAKKIIDKNEFSASKWLYKIIKITVNALVLLTAVYGVIAGSASNSSVIKTYWLLALWALQLILELLAYAVECRLEMFYAALSHDAGWLVNFIDKNSILPPKDNKYIKELEPLVEAARTEKAEMQAVIKQQKHSKRQEKIQSFKEKVTSVFVKNK